MPAPEITEINWTNGLTDMTFGGFRRIFAASTSPSGLLLRVNHVIDAAPTCSDVNRRLLAVGLRAAGGRDKWQNSHRNGASFKWRPQNGSDFRYAVGKSARVRRNWLKTALASGRSNRLPVCGLLTYRDDDAYDH